MDWLPDIIPKTVLYSVAFTLPSAIQRNLAKYKDKRTSDEKEESTDDGYTDGSENEASPVRSVQVTHKTDTAH